MDNFEMFEDLPQNEKGLLSIRPVLKPLQRQCWGYFQSDQYWYCCKGSAGDIFGQTNIGTIAKAVLANLHRDGAFFSFFSKWINTIVKLNEQGMDCSILLHSPWAGIGPMPPFLAVVCLLI